MHNSVSHWAVCLVLSSLFMGCGTGIHHGEYENIRIVDAVTGKPIAKCASVSLIAKTQWHAWTDPDETPFGDWRVVRIQSLSGQDAELCLAEYSPGHGCIFFLVQQARRGNVIFARGYEPGFYEYIELQFCNEFFHDEFRLWQEKCIKKQTDLALTTKLEPFNNNGVPDFPMIPLGTGQVEGAKADNRAFQVRAGRQKIIFLLSQKAMWDDIAAHYRAGKDSEAIRLICDSVVMMFDAISDKDKNTLDKNHIAIVNWCRNVLEK